MEPGIRDLFFPAQRASMDDLRIKRAPRLEAEITVSGDKSISHRAVLIASLANGPCVLRGFSRSADCMNTVLAMRALGIEIEQPEPEVLIVHGNRRKLTPPKGEINCGNSGTTMRLLAGILAGQPFSSRLVGDGSLSRRPMGRIIEPLRLMGAKIEAEGEHETAPLRITGRAVARHQILSPGGERAVQKRASFRRSFRQGQDHGGRTGSDPQSHRVDAQLFSRPHPEGRPRRRQRIWRSRAGIARLQHPGRHFVSRLLARRGGRSAGRSSSR